MLNYNHTGVRRGGTPVPLPPFSPTLQLLLYGVVYYDTTVFRRAGGLPPPLTTRTVTRERQRRCKASNGRPSVCVFHRVFCARGDGFSPFGLSSDQSAGFSSKAPKSGVFF